MEVKLKRSVELKVHHRIEGGYLISEKNMHRIVAKSSRLCTNVRAYGIDPASYKETYVIKKEPEGFIFREITHGGGINGHHQSLRECIITADRPHLRFYFLSEDQEPDFPITNI